MAGFQDWLNSRMASYRALTHWAIGTPNLPEEKNDIHNKKFKSSLNNNHFLVVI